MKRTKTSLVSISTLGALSVSSALALHAKPAAAQTAAPAPSAVPVQPAPVEPASADPAPAAPAPSAAPIAPAPSSEAAQPAESDPAPAAATAGPANAAESSAESRLSELEAQIAAQQEALDELKAAAEEAEMNALMADDSEAEVEVETLRFYGFMDVGLQRAWANERSIVAAVLPTNATSFVIGNVNLYMDATPAPNWRALTEIHFTNAPQGEVEEYGVVLDGVTVTPFQRRNVEQFDPHGTALNAPLWPGSIAIERAWIEYNEHQAMKMRLGSFFTPFGIWNVDHGTPTLISMAMPQFILQKYIPIRQTGLQLYGNTFSGNWELGYHVTVTNGRQELSNFDFNDEKGLGGRLYAAHQGETVGTKLGVSGYRGNVTDQVLNITSISPLEFERSTSIDYDEYVLGADVAVNAGAFRFRSEAMMRRQTFEDGKRTTPGFGLPGYTPDSYQYSGYVIAAYELPWAGLEPYFYSEVTQRPSSLIGDAILLLSPGLNMRLSTATKLKLQWTSARFFDWLEDSAPGVDTSLHNVESFYARLVVAF